MNKTDFVTESAFNRFVNLDNLEWKIISALVNSTSKYADYLWKILKYDSLDALSLPSVSIEDRKKLIYNGNGESTQYRVFLSPYTDDGWEEQSSHLHVYVNRIDPIDHLRAKVCINIEIIVHHKISILYGDASAYNDQTNPVELDENKEPIILYKNRASELLKDCIADLNGQMVNGVGVLQFNQKNSFNNYAQMNLWNGKKFFGYTISMSTQLSGVSPDSSCGD